MISMGFGSLNTFLMFGLGTLIDLCTLLYAYAYYGLRLENLKSFVEESVIDGILGRSYGSRFGRKTSSPYPRHRQYVWRHAWERPDVGSAEKGRMDVHEFVLSLRDLREEIEKLEAERVSLLAEIKRLHGRKTSMHCLFSSLSDKYNAEHKYWKRNLATVLSRLIKFPHYVKSIVKNDKKCVRMRKEAARNPKGNQNLDVTVIIPAYNEEEGIENLLESVFNQTVPPKKVIVMDDRSSDKTQNICKEIEKKHKDLVCLRQDKRCGKAHNLNVAVQLILNEKDLYSPITLVVDASGYLRKNFIEEVKKPFKQEDVVAVSGSAVSIEPKTLVGKFIDQKYLVMTSIYKFRKHAQNYRNTVTPVVGGCVAYQTEVLGKIPIPERSQTEDTDHTWLLLENGHRIVANFNAKKHCKEPETLRGFFKQWHRWYRGTFQCLFIHGRDLFKAKKLLLSTIIPGAIDGFGSSVFALVGIPLMILDPILGAKLILIDLGITGSIMAYLNRHDLKKMGFLPIVWLMKFPMIINWLYAGLRTTKQYLRDERHLWRGVWERPDVSVIKKEKIDIHEFVLGLGDLREEIKKLEAERVSLLAEIERLKRSYQTAIRRHPKGRIFTQD